MRAFDEGVVSLEFIWGNIDSHKSSFREKYFK